MLRSNPLYCITDKLLQLESIPYDITLCNTPFNKPTTVQLVKKLPSFIKTKKKLSQYWESPAMNIYPEYVQNQLKPSDIYLTIILQPRPQSTNCNFSPQIVF